jgi:TolA-binding protein
MESRAAPVGPIVESVPMMRMMPIMAAPMMMASYVPQTADRSMPREEQGCQASSSRIEQLEQRFSALEHRVDTLQSTIENQTAILQAIKTKLDGK